ncbi:hypothetical protein QQ045_001243 [Rhodiola kirilowii]
MTAPSMAVSTTPPAKMLYKKFCRDGEPPPAAAASATSGTIMAAVNTPAVTPVANFSVMEDSTLKVALALLAVDDDDAIDLDENLVGSGLNSEDGETFSEVGRDMEMDKAVVDAIVVRSSASSFLFFSLKLVSMFLRLCILVGDECEELVEEIVDEIG